MADAARALRAGDVMQDDPLYAQGYENRSFPAVQNLEVVADGSIHAVGSIRIVGIHTPGHTPGGMSWTWNTCEKERCLDIVYADSLSAVSADGYMFSTGLGAALKDSAARIAALDCDILLVTHPFLFQMQEKLAQGRESFVDDKACETYGQTYLQKVQQRLAAE